MSVQQACSHTHLTLSAPSQPASGYHRPTPVQLLAASQPSGRAPTLQRQAGVAGGKRHGIASAIAPESWLPAASTFPAPLVLPGDDLANDPKQPAQSLRAWLRLKDRNQVTKERSVVYVALPPKAAFIEGWDMPMKTRSKIDRASTRVDWCAVVEYLRAFYHGIEVRILDDELSFCPWDDTIDQSTLPSKVATRAAHGKEDVKLQPGLVGLRCPSIDQMVGIRHRPDPTGTFPHQLNLEDLLDAAMELLPEDAYTLLMLMPYDLYEGEEDDYCCGRAYGGSRIAVVSSARYQTALDETEGINREHAWPLSHCASYVSSCIPRANDISIPSSAIDVKTPMGAAVTAASSCNGSSDADNFLLCVARTASHELGHCFGLEHCVYYACVMQGTGSMAEDIRQPPYLCAMCTSKMGRAMMEGAIARHEKVDGKEGQAVWLRNWESNWCKDLGKMCKGKNCAGWKGLTAWLEKRQKT